MWDEPVDFHGFYVASKGSFRDLTIGWHETMWATGQVAVSQLEVDSKDLLQDDRANFDIHLLQQSVLLGLGISGIGGAPNV